MMRAPMRRVETPKEVACTALESLTVLHHCLNCIGVERTSKTFSLALHTLNNRHSHILFCKLCIHLQHLLCTFFRFLTSGVGCVSFLPKELRGAEEETGTHLPTHHITPLVAKDRQVT